MDVDSIDLLPWEGELWKTEKDYIKIRCPKCKAFNIKISTLGTSVNRSITYIIDTNLYKSINHINFIVMCLGSTCCANIDFGLLAKKHPARAWLDLLKIKILMETKPLLFIENIYTKIKFI